MKRLAVVLTTMSRISNNQFLATAEVSYGIVDKPDREYEDKLISWMLLNAPGIYPGWGNFKVDIRYVPDSTIEELLESGM